MSRTDQAVQVSLPLSKSRKTRLDGHTLFVGDTSPNFLAPQTVLETNFDPINGLIAISSAALSPQMIAVNSTFGVKTLQEFVELARTSSNLLPTIANSACRSM